MHNYSDWELVKMAETNGDDLSKALASRLKDKLEALHAIGVICEENEHHE